MAPQIVYSKGLVGTVGGGLTEEQAQSLQSLIGNNKLVCF